MRDSEIVTAAMSGLADNSKIAYTHRLNKYVSWCRDTEELDHGNVLPTVLKRATVQRYLDTLKDAGAVNQTLSVIKRVAHEASELGELGWEDAIAIKSISGKKVLGQHTGRWLRVEDVADVLELPSQHTHQGLRDRAILALLFGCGLRRAELVSLCVEHLDAQVTQIQNLAGKGGRVRTVGIPDWASAAVQAWLRASNIKTGPVIRSISQDGTMNGSITPAGIWLIIAGYSKEYGVAFAPHDCRRTMARLAADGGASAETIQKTLGHSSIVTTQRYINSTATPRAGDYIKLRGATNGTSNSGDCCDEP